MQLQIRNVKGDGNIIRPYQYASSRRHERERIYTKSQKDCRIKIRPTMKHMILLKAWQRILYLYKEKKMTANCSIIIGYRHDLDSIDHCYEKISKTSIMASALEVEIVRHLLSTIDIHLIVLSSTTSIDAYKKNLEHLSDKWLEDTNHLITVFSNQRNKHSLQVHAFQ